MSEAVAAQPAPPIVRDLEAKFGSAWRYQRTVDGIPTVETVKRLGIDFATVLETLAANGVR